MGTQVDAAIRATDLRKSFRSTRALDGLSLEVRVGELLGLVGPNGAGKTTFIRILAGLLRPSGGTVRVFGEPPGLRAAARIGYMTQSPALYEDLPVRDNLVFFGRLFGLRAEDARARAAELIELVGLEGRAGSLVRELSGGLRQRTNLACAMVHRPELLLLDEPTVGVDPVLRIRLWDHFSRLVRDGSTILLTTHVMDEADRCDRVAFLSDGRSIADGPPSELRARAATDSLEHAFLALRDTVSPDR